MAISTSSSTSSSSPSTSETTLSLRSQVETATATATPTSSGHRTGRTRTIMTPFQARILRRVLETTAFPTSDLRDNLAKILGMKARTIQIWFQNQRQKTRQRQKSREQQQPAGLPVFPQVDLKWSRFHGAFHNLSPGLHPSSVAADPAISCTQTLQSHSLHPIPGYRFRYHPYNPPSVTQPSTPQPQMPTVMRMPLVTEQHLLSEITQELRQEKQQRPMVPESAPLLESFSPVKQQQIRLIHRAPLDALCEAAVASMPEPDEWDGAITLLSAVDMRRLSDRQVATGHEGKMRPW